MDLGVAAHQDVHRRLCNRPAIQDVGRRKVRQVFPDPVESRARVPRREGRSLGVSRALRFRYGTHGILRMRINGARTEGSSRALFPGRICSPPLTAGAHCLRGHGSTGIGRLVPDDIDAAFEESAIFNGNCRRDQVADDVAGPTNLDLLARGNVSRN